MSRRKIVRSKTAEEDLLGLWLHIAERDFAAAERFFDAIEATERRLIDYPELGTRRRELGNEVRMVRIGVDLLFYRLNEKNIRILRVMDGRRNIGVADLVV